MNIGWPGLLVGGCLLTITTGQSLAAGDPAAGKAKSAICAACHQADGNSINPLWPKISGQFYSYMVKQLRDYKNGTRSDPTMSPMAAALSEQDIQDLAAYYSRQTIESGTANPKLLAAGRKVYRSGNVDSAVTACIGCHGPKGMGNQYWEVTLAAPPAVLAPAIGGQHVVYLVKQLAAFKSGTRQNDVGKVMQHIAARMSDEEIDAVAQYIAALQ